MKTRILIFFLLLLSACLSGQNVGINDDNSDPHASAMLDVKSANKGFLPPRMNKQQMYTIGSPTDGLMVFCTDCSPIGSGALMVYISGSWYICNVACLAPDPPSAGTSIPNVVQIIWNWNAVAGATGYKWNTTNNYATAIDVGTSVTWTETSLNCQTIYTRYVWAYNACGTSSPTTITQTTTVCPPCPSITDARDGKTYNTVLIGAQCWMAQNLNVGIMLLGIQPQGCDNELIYKYCYNNSEGNCDVYGGLYQWNQAMQCSTAEGVQGICPAGWHLPTDAEWATLTTYLGGIWVAGGKMKETGTAHWSSPNSSATNTSGFTALPGGYNDLNSPYTFSDQSYKAYFWSSSQYSSTKAWSRNIYYRAGDVSRYSDLKRYGFSVRCLKD